ncbi:MAG: MgtC/SapB family protein [Gemmatimonadota bacterium]
MSLSLFAQLAIALGLGLLIGLQRERTSSEMAGIRTFPLIALFGFLSGFLAGELGVWVTVAALLALSLIIVASQLMTRRAGGEVDPGLTTEVAALVTFVVGVIVALDHIALAVFVGGAAMLLLQWKGPLHRLAERIGHDEFRALTRLVLLALVILPVLPDRAYGPYGVLNPFRIWLMVVLIVGISLAGYVAYRFLGDRVGTLAAGAIGGLISSTAATVGFARHSTENPGWAVPAAVMVVIASTVTFARVLFEIAVVAPSALLGLGAPVAVMMLAMTAMSAALYWSARRVLREIPDQRTPPSGLRAALAFGVLYAAVLLGVAVAKEHFGLGGMYVVAALSGLTDMDAITLSTAQLVRSGDVGVDVGWRLILIGGLANLVFKGIAVAILGRGRTRTLVGGAFAGALAFGVLLLWAWP